jgi:hypothetical protein
VLRLTYRSKTNSPPTKSVEFDFVTSVQPVLPKGYKKIGSEPFIYNAAVAADFAYGSTGAFGVGGNPNTGYSFVPNLSGEVKFFDNAINTNGVSFGDPSPGMSNDAYRRSICPFSVREVVKNSNSWAIEFQPMRLKAFLEDLGDAADISINNSIAINIDTRSINSKYLAKNPAGINIPARFKPNLKDDAPKAVQYGLILKGCSDLTDFDKGFSLVTDMRLFIGDDFNAVKKLPIPASYPIKYPAGKDYYVPCSLFAPQKRYGFDDDATFVDIKGQMGSLADDRGNQVGANFESVRLLDSKQRSYDPSDPTKGVMTPAQIKVNLFSIGVIEEVPPIMMKNWLITAEEIRN